MGHTIDVSKYVRIPDCFSKPKGVREQNFGKHSIKNVYNLATECMCLVWISEQAAIISLYSVNWSVFITETGCVYCAVRTASLNVTHDNLPTFLRRSSLCHRANVCCLALPSVTILQPDLLSGSVTTDVGKLAFCEFGIHRTVHRDIFL